jgi:hypothetical protein
VAYDDIQRRDFVETVIKLRTLRLNFSLMSNSKFLTDFGLLVVGFSPLEGRFYIRVVHVGFFFCG